MTKSSPKEETLQDGALTVFQLFDSFLLFLEIQHITAYPKRKQDAK